MDEKTAEQLNEFMIDSVNKAFIMGMNFQRLKTLESLQDLESDMSMEDKARLGVDLDLFKEATDADLPTPSND